MFVVLFANHRKSVASGQHMRTQRVRRGRSLPCFQQLSGGAMKRRGQEQNAPRTGRSLALCSEHWLESWDQHTSIVSDCRWGGMISTQGVQSEMLTLSHHRYRLNQQLLSVEICKLVTESDVISLFRRSWRVCCWRPRKAQRACRKLSESRLEIIACSRMNCGLSSTVSGSLWMMSSQRGVVSFRTREVQRQTHPLCLFQL